jgi:GINS complex subunit 2
MTETNTMSRKIGASKEQARREQMAEEMANGGYDATQDDEDEMEF